MLYSLVMNSVLNVYDAVERENKSKTKFKSDMDAYMADQKKSASES